MTEPDDVERIRRTLAPHVPGDPPATADCLDDDMVAAIAEGMLGEEDRETALRHLAVCVRCRSQVAGVARALADPGIAQEAGTSGSARRRLRAGWRGWATVAAAAMLLLFAWPREYELEHRSAPITSAPAPTAVAPVGTVADARSFQWTPVDGADRYRIVVFDADAELLYETELTGTVAALPDSVLVRLVPGEIYSWRVEARVDFGRWVDSDAEEFSIARRP